MARKTMTRQEATRLARERSAERLEREYKIVKLAADWMLANDELNAIYLRLYALGLNRSSVADRLGIPTAVVPRLEDLSEHESLDQEEPVDVESPEPAEDAGAAHVDGTAEQAS